MDSSFSALNDSKILYQGKASVLLVLQREWRSRKAEHPLGKGEEKQGIPRNRNEVHRSGKTISRALSSCSLSLPEQAHQGR